MNDEWYHFPILNKSYEKVSNLVLEKNSLDMTDISASRRLFTEESLSSNNPKPIEVDVYAILSGSVSNSIPRSNNSYYSRIKW